MTSREPPGPPGQPFLGHVAQIRRDPMRLYLDCMREYGDVVRLRFLGKNSYLLCHPDHVKLVVQENWTNFDKQSPGYVKLRDVFGDGLVTSEGAFWRRQRRIAQPAFHRARVEGFVNVMTSATAAMLKQWKAHAERGRVIDVSVEMMSVAQRIVSEALLGTEVPEDTEAVGVAVVHLLADTIDRMVLPLDLPKWVPTARNKRFHRELARVDVIFERAIRARRQDRQPRPDLLSMLMEARDEETGEQMSDAQVRDEMITMFMAGHETTANAITWTLYLLSKNPGVRRELAQEAKSVLGDRTPTLDDVRKLKLTERIVKESMRLRPPISKIGRRIVNDVEIDGYRLGAGDYVVLSSYVTHRHPDFWENPEGFDPDRFTPEREAARHRYAYFPFLAGPRVCIGNVFAMTEATIVLAMIAREFELDVMPDQVVQNEVTITLRPRFGMRMRVRKAGAGLTGALPAASVHRGPSPASSELPIA